jgi:hypothetical protein
MQKLTQAEVDECVRDWKFEREAPLRRALYTQIVGTLKDHPVEAAMASHNQLYVQFITMLKRDNLRWSSCVTCCQNPFWTTDGRCCDLDMSQLSASEKELVVFAAKHMSDEYTLTKLAVPRCEVTFGLVPDLADTFSSICALRRRFMSRLHASRPAGLAPQPIRHFFRAAELPPQKSHPPATMTECRTECGTGALLHPDEYGDTCVAGRLAGGLTMDSDRPDIKTTLIRNLSETKICVSSAPRIKALPRSTVYSPELFRTKVAVVEPYRDAKVERDDTHTIFYLHNGFWNALPFAQIARAAVLTITAKQIADDVTFRAFPHIVGPSPGI